MAPTRQICVPDAVAGVAAEAGAAWAAGAEAGAMAAEEGVGEVNHGGEEAALRAGPLDDTSAMPTRQVWAGALSLDAWSGAAGATAEDARCTLAAGAAVDNGAPGASARRLGSRAETSAMPTRHVRVSAESVERTACAGLGCIVEDGAEGRLEEMATGPTRHVRNRLSLPCRLSLLGSVMFFMYDSSSIWVARGRSNRSVVVSS